MKSLLPIIAWCLAVMAILTTTAQTADFGDAPDGGTFNGLPLNYNSLMASNGPQHTSAASGTFWIAKNKGLLVPDMEPDSRQINQDIDNGQPFIFVYLLSIPAPATVSVPVVTSPGHNPNTTLYLNVAIDVDDDFDYENTPDVNWVVRNRPFTMPADTTVAIVSDWFGFGSNLVLFPVWLRATVTDVPVANGWHDGSTTNVYGDGETEDWFYTFGRDGGYPPEWTNPPRDPGDTADMKKPKPANPPPPTKCAKLYHPKVVYVKCDKVKCFNVVVRNCDGVDLTNVNFNFKFKAGNPLPGKPAVAGASVGGPPYNVTANKKATFTICVKGWPCDPVIEDRWARYDVKLSYDPDGLYDEFIGEITFGSHEQPFLDSSFTSYLGVEPVVDTADSPIWEAEEGEFMNYNLVTFTGRTDLGMRWITGKPILVPRQMPAWATLMETLVTADSTFYQISGTPPVNAPGIDTFIFTAMSDMPTDTFVVKPRDYSFAVHTTMKNAAPEFDSTLLASTSLSVGDTLSGMLKVSDPDIARGRRDTTFIDYYFYDPVADTVVSPGTIPTFTDHGDGTASFSWEPGVLDIGVYELRTVAWDYSFAETMAITNLTVNTGLKDPMGSPGFLRTQPNPFRDNTTVVFALSARNNVRIEVRDLQGRLVTTVASGMFPAGRHTIEWNAGEMPAGTYFIHLITTDQVATEKAVLLR